LPAQQFGKRRRPARKVLGQKACLRGAAQLSVFRTSHWIGDLCLPLQGQQMSHK
jgi:hypothetical protein